MKKGKIYCIEAFTMIKLSFKIVKIVKITLKQLRGSNVATRKQSIFSRMIPLFDPDFFSTKFRAMFCVLVNF